MSAAPTIHSAGRFAAAAGTALNGTSDGTVQIRVEDHWGDPARAFQTGMTVETARAFAAAIIAAADEAEAR